MPTAPTARFLSSMRQFFARDTAVMRTMRVSRYRCIYDAGDHDETIYYVVSGEVKLMMSMPEGREFTVDIVMEGEVFGESCLGANTRTEAAVAMQRTVLKSMAYRDFLPFLHHHSLFEDFARHLAARVVILQTLAATLGTMRTEARLAAVLLTLARKSDAQGSGPVMLRHRISQEELALLAGTTRARVSTFLKRFRECGLVESSHQRNLIVRVDRLQRYLRM